MNNNSFFDEVRNAVEGESIDYNSGNWESLKMRLDKRRKRRFGFFFFRGFNCLGITLGCLILLSLLTWYFTSNHQAAREKNAARSQASHDLHAVSEPSRPGVPTISPNKLAPASGSGKEMIANENKISKEHDSATTQHNHFSSKHNRPNAPTADPAIVIPGAASNQEMIADKNKISKKQHSATLQHNHFSGTTGTKTGRKNKKKVHRSKLTRQLPAKNSMRVIPADIDEDEMPGSDKPVMKATQSDSSKQDSLLSSIPNRNHIPDSLNKKTTDTNMVKKKSKRNTGAFSLFGMLGISGGKHFAGWNSEIMIDKPLSDQFSVQAGLSYYGFHGKIPVTTMHIEEIPQPGVGVIYDTTYSSSQRSATSHYAGLFAGFSWQQKKYSLFIHGYCNYNLLAKSKLERISMDAREKYSNYSAGIRAGGYYNLNSRHSIGIAGRFDFFKFYNINPGNSFQLNYRVKLF